MSTPSRPPLAPHPTRQQLDELDALMKRMLALPVEEVDVPRDSREPEPPAREPLPPAADGPEVVAEVESPPVPRPRRLRSPAPALLRKDTYVALAGEEAPRYFSDEAAPPGPTGDAPPAAPPLFLAWPNLLFDAATYLVGPAGGWLRGPSGRGVLGRVGLLLLVGAVAWGLVDWLGWTR